MARTVLAWAFLIISWSASISESSSPAIVFVDVTKPAGLSDFRMVCGSPAKDYIIESMTGGAAFLDFDNDGWLDIYLVNGSVLEDARAGRPAVPVNSTATAATVLSKTSLKEQAPQTEAGGWVSARRISMATDGSTFI